MLTSKSSCTCLCTQNIKDKSYIKDGLLGVHSVQYVEFVLSFKRMYYLHPQSDWIWCKRKLRWFEEDKFYIKEGLLGVHTVQYVEYVLSFKRMYYLYLQSDWIWCKRKLRRLEGGNMSITHEGLNDLGQTYISLAKCVNCPNIRFINKIWHGILPQKPIGIQVYANFPCYFGQHSTLHSQSRDPI